MPSPFLRFGIVTHEVDGSVVQGRQIVQVDVPDGAVALAGSIMTDTGLAGVYGCAPIGDPATGWQFEFEGGSSPPNMYRFSVTYVM